MTKYQIKDAGTGTVKIITASTPLKARNKYKHTVGAYTEQLIITLYTKK